LIEFYLEHCGQAFANALRRVMIAEVPTMAFEDLEFLQNTSTLPDEFIAHRIGLCPLVSEQADKFLFRQECDCSGGCPKCEVVYYISVRNETENPQVVTTDDLILWEAEEHEDNPHFRTFLDAARTVKPVRPPAVPGGDPVPIVIAKLGPGQVIQATCKAQKNYGREHAKWSPCCCSSYHMQAEIWLDPVFFAAQTQEWKEAFVSTCPSRVFRFDQSTNTVVTENELECTFCRQCAESLEEEKNHDKVHITEKADKYLFRVEGTGAIRPQTIVSRAFEILKQKLENLLKHVQSIPLE
jgi:DNA-directed RNA polymerase II subunit RPB3